MSDLKVGRVEFSPGGVKGWLIAEKHSAQADAERHKNVADTLRLRIAELEAEVAELRKDKARLDALVYTPIGTTWKQTAEARFEIMQDLRAKLRDAMERKA